MKKNSKDEIMTIGRKEFLKKGFKDASLRQIVKEAGVTTGAFYAHFKDKDALYEVLIKPAVGVIEKLYADTAAEYGHYVEAPEKMNVNLWLQSKERMRHHLKDIYANLEAFQLLVASSDGTKYDTYIYDFIQSSVEQTKRYFAYLKTIGIETNAITEKELEVLIHTHFSSIYQVVSMGMSYEEAQHYVDTVNTFFNAGWQQVLNFKSI